MGQWNRSVHVSTHNKWDNGTGQYRSVLTVCRTRNRGTGQYLSVLTVCRTTEHVSSHSMQDKGTGQYSQYAGHGKRSVLTVCRTREQVNKWPLSVISALYNFKFFTSTRPYTVTQTQVHQHYTETTY